MRPSRNIPNIGAESADLESVLFQWVILLLSVYFVDFIGISAFQGHSSDFVWFVLRAEQIGVVFAEIEADDAAHIDVPVSNWGDVAEKIIGRSRLARVDHQLNVTGIPGHDDILASSVNAPEIAINCSLVRPRLAICLRQNIP